MKLRSFLALAVLAGVAATSLQAQAIRTNPGFSSRSIPRNDDGSSALEPLGFSINLFGKIRAAGYVNNNGNMTFDSALSTYTPFGLRGTEREIIAPFFADVDTRPEGSKLVTYGQDTVNGHRAFGVNYVDVGYYANHTDKTNSFQMVLIEREDLGPGDFDIEFNYERIAWETGDASDGVNGFGGVSASVGWSNGTDTSFELPGSLQPGSFLDNGPNALVRQSLTGAVVNTATSQSRARLGRLVFRARDGVISPGLVVSGGNLPDATTGVYYEQRLTVSGAEPPYRWQLIPDVTAPAGLTLYANGDLAGTPTAAGTYSFTITVTGETEDGEVTASERASITVRPPTVKILTYCPMPDAHVGSPYWWQLSAVGASNIQWRLLGPSALPQGLSLSPAGLLAGTPQQPGTYALNFDATAEGATPAHLECKLIVNPAGVRLTNCSLPRATVGVPFSNLLLPSGGTSPYTFQLIGDLPQGVVLNEDGRISGTANYWGVWIFKIATTDAQNVRNVQDCSLIVDPARFSTSVCPLPSAMTGVPYSVSLGTGYVWSVLGNLPGGLTLNPSGSISGTPMSAGGAQFRLLATNSAGEQSAEVCSLVVNRGPLGIFGCPAPDARLGEPYSASLNGSGGSAPYVLSTVAGALPAGLQLSPGGSITGRPTATGNFGFTLRVRDSLGATATQACTLKVGPATLRLTNACPVPDGYAGEPYTHAISVEGGTAPLRFTLGSLPDGLTVSNDGVISGTPRFTGGRTFSLSVTDALGAAAQQTCSIAIREPRVPAVSLAAPPATVAPASSLNLQVRLNQPYSAPVRGQLVLKITPETAGNDPIVDAPDPHLAFANGQRTAAFTIPAGQTSVTVPVASTGTAAATVEVSIQNLTASGAPVTQYPAAVFFRIAPAPPSITSACYERTNSEQGVLLTFDVTGFSNTRELRQARITIPGLAKPGNRFFVPEEFIFENTDTVPVDAAAVAEGYFATSTNVANGGAFRMFLPARFEQAPNYVAPTARLEGVQIELVNSVGGSGPRNANECP